MNLRNTILTLACLISAGISFAVPCHPSDQYGPVSYKLNASPDTTGEENIQIKPFILDIVAPSSGVQFYRNGIIFLSYTKVEEKVPDKHLSFGSLKTYLALVMDTVPGDYMPFLPASSKVFPSEAATCTEDFNTMCLSLIPDRGNKEKIFMATLKSDNWVIEDQALNFCDGNYIYSHPSLSTDGKFMVFSSDMSGSLGGLDLYVTKKEDGRWSAPENLGKHINSAGNELFASLDSRNNLFFSSDGLPGEGGYDVFVCLYDGTGWVKPVNLSGTINSEDDELAFTVSRTDRQSAFYTSRPKSGKGRTQLFHVKSETTLKSNLHSDLSAGLFAMAGIKPPMQPEKQALLPPESVAPPQKVEQKAPAAEQKATAKTAEPEMKTVETKATPAPSNKPAATTPTQEKNDVVVYRVQILANTRPVGSQNITVAGQTYKSFEYLYQGGYRTTIGDFKTLAEAVKLQKICRQNAYSQAFVVAFKNNIRSTDPELFK
ncbi:SPOR domain-containing protein [bacterium]|nr:SPOR domain-containing protein [bacterium]